MPLHELDILAAIRARFSGGEGLMDDCGALPAASPGETLLVTTDLLEEGTHFRRDWHPPELLARKLLAVNLSDLDGSGAWPLGFTLTLALPPDLDPAWLEAFLDALAKAAAEAGVPLLGGDTVGRPSGLGLGLTAFGAAARWLRRDGLRAGDALYVDQPLGRSLRGLRKLQAGRRWDPAAPDPDLAAHLDPRPNLGLGPRLAALPEVHGAMDVSDGLSKDARWMAQASSVSIELAPGLDEDALRGGEDYARLFGAALPQAELEGRLGLPLIPVGRVVAREEHPLFFYDGGQRCPLPDLSFDHFR
ncbi:MAG TPA: AIR synthase related protein [Holophagaceae bacterium]|nr:AIR synthase related protein [Holophagaceae bacterium]